MDESQTRDTTRTTDTVYRRARLLPQLRLRHHKPIFILKSDRLHDPIFILKSDRHHDPIFTLKNA
ncbi:MAG: hypothetical protein DSM106950_44810 [Stigonema ocellatum SAG 48.90 = DSM 106950]|nr:hypothetical protein [Stigonema ocellatum SAG 48.90 = DSM 106950]